MDDIALPYSLYSDHDIASTNLVSVYGPHHNDRNGTDDDGEDEPLTEKQFPSGGNQEILGLRNSKGSDGRTAS